MSFLKTFFVVAAAASLALPLVGCASSKPVTMADSFDLDIFGPHVDDLHTPYVAGAQFQITVSADGNSQQGGWTLTSSDPSVMQVTSALGAGTAGVTAGNPGQTTLSVLDENGKVLDSHVVTVAIPDQVNLYAQGLLLTGATDSAAQISQASIVTGGEATFLVRYFEQGTELFGSGALAVSGTKGVTAMTATESFATARDFVQVTPAPMGSAGTVSLIIDKVTVGELPITTVEPSAVTHVTMLPQADNNAQTGDSLVLYAHAVDGSSADVFGASFNWSINGQSQGDTTYGGPADLFFYNFDSGSTETVAAAYESFSPSLVVHGQGGSIGSSGNLGCSLSGVPGASGGGGNLAGIFAVALMGLAAFVGHRRRVVRQP